MGVVRWAGAQVGWALGEQMLMAVTDNQYNQKPTIYIYNVAADVKERTPTQPLSPLPRDSVCSLAPCAVLCVVLCRIDDG
jgi:hypothetical protein